MPQARHAQGTAKKDRARPISNSGHSHEQSRLSLAPFFRNALPVSTERVVSATKFQSQSRFSDMTSTQSASHQPGLHIPTQRSKLFRCPLTRPDNVRPRCTCPHVRCQLACPRFWHAAFFHLSLTLTQPGKIQCQGNHKQKSTFLLAWVDKARGITEAKSVTIDPPGQSRFCQKGRGNATRRSDPPTEYT